MLLFAQIVVNYKQMFRKIITYISGDNVLHCIGVNLLFGRHYIVLSAIPDNYKNKWRKTRPVFIKKIKVNVKKLRLLQDQNYFCYTFSCIWRVNIKVVMQK